MGATGAGALGLQARQVIFKFLSRDRLAPITSEFGRRSLILSLTATESKVSASRGVSIWRTNRQSVNSAAALGQESTCLGCIFAVVAGCKVHFRCGFVDVWFLGKVNSEARWNPLPIVIKG